MAADTGPRKQAGPLLVDVWKLQHGQALVPQPCVCYLRSKVRSTEFFPKLLRDPGPALLTQLCTHLKRSREQQL